MFRFQTTGIVGYFTDGEIAGTAGGITGTPNNEAPISIINCYNVGLIDGSDGQDTSGGIIGISKNSSIIQNSVSMTNIISQTGISRIYGGVSFALTGNNYAYENLEMNGVIVSSGTPTDSKGGNKTFVELTNSSKSSNIKKFRTIKTKSSFINKH